MNKFIVLVFTLLPILIGCNRSHRAVEQAMRRGDPFVLMMRFDSTREGGSGTYVLDSSLGTISFHEFYNPYNTPLLSGSTDPKYVAEVRRMICDSDFFSRSDNVGEIVPDGGIVTVELKCNADTIEKRFYRVTKAHTNFPIDKLRIILEDEVQSLSQAKPKRASP